MYRGLSCTIQGADHIARNMICQDAAGECYHGHYGAAVVADGHGGAKYIRSDVGARMAVDSAIATIEAFMADYGRFTEAIRRDSSFVLRRMGEQFFARWTEAIAAYHDAHPLTEEEKKKVPDGDMSFYTYYGSTILAAVMADDYYYGLLVGDGGFVVVDEAINVSIPIEDKNSYANYVSSICSRNAIDAMDCFFRAGKPLLMAVSTDGLIKSFSSEKDFKDYHILLAASLQDLEKCRASVEKNFRKRTEQGSGDDISISLVFSEERLRAGKDAVLARMNAQREAKRLREIEEEKRLLREKEQAEQQKIRDMAGEMAELDRQREDLQRRMALNQDTVDKIERERQRRLSVIQEENSQFMRLSESIDRQKAEVAQRMQESREKLQFLQDGPENRDRSQIAQEGAGPGEKQEPSASGEREADSPEKTGLRDRIGEYGSHIRKFMTDDDFLVQPEHLRGDPEKMDLEDYTEELIINQRNQNT